MGSPRIWGHSDPKLHYERSERGGEAGEREKRKALQGRILRNRRLGVEGNEKEENGKLELIEYQVT